MRMVFLDSVGLLATWDTRDQWHMKANPVFDQLLREGALLFTTELILAECGNAAARKPYRARVEALRKTLARQGRVVDLNLDVLDQAWRNYSLAGPSGAGLVDQVSFIIIRQLGTREVFSNDRHFQDAGFITLF